MDVQTRQAKRALITGMTGQDGSYLAELLAQKGYQVWGLVRRASASNLGRIQHLVSDPPAAAAIVHSQQDELCLGNLNSRRDWGFAGDFVHAMWLMLQADQPDDYVIATGQTHSVRDFCSLAFDCAGLPLNWTGQGVDERGIGPDGRTRVRVDPRFFRPTEVDQLCGDASKVRKVLGWQPTVTFHQLVEMMVGADLALLARQRESCSPASRPHNPITGEEHTADNPPDKHMWHCRDSCRGFPTPHSVEHARQTGT